MEFVGWPKTPRLYRDIVITEKIDGTNAAVIIEPLDLADDVDNVAAVVLVREGNEPDTLRPFRVGAQSRNRIITPEDDNYGFATWVRDNAEGLFMALGPGRHFGEWWGAGIQRKYGLTEKRFSLFNVDRHKDLDSAIVDTVPVLYRGPFAEFQIDFALETLRSFGSAAAPGFMDPEGVCVFHTASRQVFKVLLENDKLPKSAALRVAA